jgi:hypothetical protein
VGNSKQGRRDKGEAKHDERRIKVRKKYKEMNIIRWSTGRRQSKTRI